MTTTTELSTIEQTTRIVAAYVGANAIAASSVPELLRSVYGALTSLSDPEPTSAPEEELKPAVPIRKSVTPNYIICLEDGAKFTSLKRHLKAKYGMTPDEYRTKWGLPADYPMAAPAYSARRSAMAKKSGLGRKPVAQKVAA